MRLKFANFMLSFFQEFQLPSKDDRQQKLDSWLALMSDGPFPDCPICLPVLSGSMLPDIPVNSSAHIEKTKASHCRRGQVVVYRDEERLVIHRVLWRLGYGSSFLIYEKGDANVKGNWLRGNRVRGIVVAIDYLDGEGPKELMINANLAWKSLYSDLKYRILFLPRRIKRLLTGPRT